MFLEIELLNAFLLRDSVASSYWTLNAIILFHFPFPWNKELSHVGDVSEGKTPHFNEMRLICKVEILVNISCETGDTNKDKQSIIKRLTV